MDSPLLDMVLFVIWGLWTETQETLFIPNISQYYAIMHIADI